jgi:hypothetical protein
MGFDTNCALGSQDSGDLFQHRYNPDDFSLKHFTLKKETGPIFTAMNGTI